MRNGALDVRGKAMKDGEEQRDLGAVSTWWDNLTGAEQFFISLVFIPLAVVSLILAGVTLCKWIIFAILPRLDKRVPPEWVNSLKSRFGVIVGTLVLISVLIFGLIFIALFGLAVIITFLLLLSVLSDNSVVDTHQSPSSSLGLGALLVALLGAPLLIWRSIVAQKTVNVTEHGQITDRINAAVASLGTEKQVHQPLINEEGIPLYKKDKSVKPGGRKPITEIVTLPNMEVRMGGIYALERIARDKLVFHTQIMEILCVYIWENSPAGKTDENGNEAQIPDGIKDRTDIDLRADIEAVLKVLRRRTKDQIEQEQKWPGELADESDSDGYSGYRLDLRGTDLQDHDLRGINLNHARLQSANLQYVKLQGAKLQGAKLWRAQLQGAKLWRARLQEADLENANLQGADLRGVKMSEGTILEGANLKGAAVRYVNDTTLKKLRPFWHDISANGSAIFADGSVREAFDALGTKKDWPAHWPTGTLDDEDFDNEWRKWRADPKNYIPPEPPAP